MEYGIFGSVPNFNQKEARKKSCLASAVQLIEIWDPSSKIPHSTTMVNMVLHGPPLGGAKPPLVFQRPPL